MTMRFAERFRLIVREGMNPPQAFVSMKTWRPAVRPRKRAHGRRNERGRQAFQGRLRRCRDRFHLQQSFRVRFIGSSSRAFEAHDHAKSVERARSRLSFNAGYHARAGAGGELFTRQQGRSPAGFSQNVNQWQLSGAFGHAGNGEDRCMADMLRCPGFRPSKVENSMLPAGTLPKEPGR